MKALCEHLKQIQIKAREEGPMSKMTLVYLYHGVYTPWGSSQGEELGMGGVKRTMVGMSPLFATDINSGQGTIYMLMILLLMVCWLDLFHHQMNNSSCCPINVVHGANFKVPSSEQIR